MKPEEVYVIRKILIKDSIFAHKECIPSKRSILYPARIYSLDVSIKLIRIFIILIIFNLILFGIVLLIGGLDGEEMMLLLLASIILLPYLYKYKKYLESIKAKCIYQGP